MPHAAIHQVRIITDIVCALREVVHAAATALQFFQQGIANWRELKSWGFKGWDFTSNPCQGWSGVSCDVAGRVSKL